MAWRRQQIQGTTIRVLPGWMSRKKGDLRLKRKSEYSTSEIATAAAVQNSVKCSDFRPVNLISSQNRLLLHKLLLGESPQPFPSLPTSQLMNSSITAREPPKDHSLSPHKEELKWTQLPPTKILKRPIPRFMTVEQLCAPVPNEMGKDASEVERTMKTLPTIPSEQKMEPAQIGNNLAKGELSDDSVVKTNTVKSFISKNKNKYSPLKTAIHSEECKFKYKAASALSHPNHRNIDLTNTSKTYIDLTNTSKTQQVGTSIHDHHATSCKNGKIASESRKHKTEFCKESFGEDLEHLCTGIDIESIEDFSDDECPGINDKHSTPVLAERVPKRAPHTIETNRLNTKCFKNNRGKLKGKHSIRDGDKPRNLTQLPISGHSTYRSSQSESTNCSMKRTLTFQQNARFTHTVSSSTCTDKKVATRKRPQAAETSTRTKQPRLAMDSGSMAGKRAHTDTEGKTALQATTQCHGSSQSTAACPTPSGAAGSTASSGNGAVLSPRLSTERCPMCNTCFPAWYTQVDADGHIAECLQAVLDFEQANNLVLD